MNKFKTLVFGAMLVAASAGAMARPIADTTPGIDARQAEQAARIDQAVREGKLSRNELRDLKREQASIRRYEARAKSDGIVTRAERMELQKMLDRASRHIRNS